MLHIRIFPHIYKQLQPTGFLYILLNFKENVRVQMHLLSKPRFILPLSALTLRTTAQPLLAISLNCPIAHTSTKPSPTSLQDWMLDRENQPLWWPSAAPRWAWDLFHSFMLFLVSGIPWWRLQADWTEQEMSVAFDNRTDGYSITGADVKSKPKLCH